MNSKDLVVSLLSGFLLGAPLAMLDAICKRTNGAACSNGGPYSFLVPFMPKYCDSFDSFKEAMMAQSVFVRCAPIGLLGIGACIAASHHSSIQPLGLVSAYFSMGITRELVFRTYLEPGDRSIFRG